MHPLLTFKIPALHLRVALISVVKVVTFLWSGLSMCGSSSRVYVACRLPFVHTLLTSFSKTLYFVRYSLRHAMSLPEWHTHTLHSLAYHSSGFEWVRFLRLTLQWVQCPVLSTTCIRIPLLLMAFSCILFNSSFLTSLERIAQNRIHLSCTTSSSSLPSPLIFPLVSLF